MDNIDQKFEEYIETLVQGVLTTQPSLNKEALTDYFYNLILDTLVDNLTPEQLVEMEKLNPESPEMEAKIMEYASLMPNFLNILEEKFQKQAELIKNTGQIPVGT